MPPKGQRTQEEEAEAKKRNSENKRRWRANRSEEQRLEERERNAENKRNRIAGLSEEQRSLERRKNAENERNRVASLSAEQRSLERENNVINKRNRIANLSDEQRSHERAKNAENERNRVASLSEGQRSLERERNSQNKRSKIANMTVPQRNVHRLEHAAVASTSRAARRLQTLNQTTLAASINRFNEADLQQHNCIALIAICSFCGAKHFLMERPQDKKFTQCCQKGKVVLPPIKLALGIEKLMKKEHEYSNNFFENIRSINSALAFASMGANIAPPPGYGPYCFRINGQIYHRTGSLHPTGAKENLPNFIFLTPMRHVIKE
ncbi:hypothetical protein Fcan01_18731 [Folsomia candida]|uniref:Uncharacterized protein n=1 Tax=Folsomia candida TaxID=158441 RepID=A0A226DP05_FOLCA|nr:hypothetical protein Fcan01_18731 [Folsomia candida]